MPIYDYRCATGHLFEQSAPMASGDRSTCPACGEQSMKVPSRVAIGGLADPGRSMEEMPQTWRGTHNGDPEYLGRLRREWSAREKLEETYGELRGDRRPILAHEGQYHDRPLRAGDDPAAARAGRGGQAGGGAHGGSSGHGHGHSHAPGGGHSHGPGGTSHPDPSVVAPKTAAGKDVR